MWEVLDTGYKEVWHFASDGKWISYTSLEAYKNDSPCHDGEWWVQPIGDGSKRQLRIRYGKMMIVHELGTNHHYKHQLILGEVYENLKLRFVRRISK